MLKVLTNYFLKRNNPSSTKALKAISFFRNYWIDIATYCTAVIVYSITYSAFKHQGFILIFSVLLTTVTTAVIIYTRSHVRDFFFMALDRENQRYDWMGQGTFSYQRTDKCFRITQSFSGFIFSKCLSWTNYKVVFQFKILNKCVGVIVRADDLSNFVMLQIGDKGIAPHVRTNGAFVRYDLPELIYDQNHSLDRWYICGITVDGLEVQVSLEDGENELFNRTWTIPREVLLRTIDENGRESLSQFKYPVNFDYGTIGFRNDRDESAIVKNLLVEKI